MPSWRDRRHNAGQNTYDIMNGMNAAFEGIIKLYSITKDKQAQEQALLADQRNQEIEARKERNKFTSLHGGYLVDTATGKETEVYIPEGDKSPFNINYKSAVLDNEKKQAELNKLREIEEGDKKQLGGLYTLFRELDHTKKLVEDNSHIFGPTVKVANIIQGKWDQFTNNLDTILNGKDTSEKEFNKSWMDTWNKNIGNDLAEARKNGTISQNDYNATLLMQSRFMSLAYAIATSREPGAKQFNEGDIQRAMVTLGSLSDPGESILMRIDDLKTNALFRVDEAKERLKLNPNLTKETFGQVDNMFKPWYNSNKQKESKKTNAPLNEQPKTVSTPEEPKKPEDMTDAEFMGFYLK